MKKKRRLFSKTIKKPVAGSTKYVLAKIESIKKRNRMTHCPYPETIIDQASDKTESNNLYLAWHEGYEAHKFEFANLSIQLACLTVELDTKIRNVQELKRELQKQRSKLQEAN